MKKQFILKIKQLEIYKRILAETLAEIDAKVLELGLTDPDMLVTPH